MGKPVNLDISLRVLEDWYRKMVETFADILSQSKLNDCDARAAKKEAYDKIALANIKLEHISKAQPEEVADLQQLQKCLLIISQIINLANIVLQPS